ncbi:hypothetical protein L9F63_019168, partial [Diploptera punctata]
GVRNKAMFKQTNPKKFHWMILVFNTFFFYIDWASENRYFEDLTAVSELISI